MKKMPKILSVIILILISFIGVIYTNNTNNNNNQEKLKIHYIDVGQGDSELIQIGNKNILVDAGNNDKMTYNYLNKLGINTIDYVIATHPHSDHIGGMTTILKNFQVNKFYSPKITTNTKTYENMINELKNKNLKITVPEVGDTIDFEGASITFLAPNNKNYKDLNNYSIVFRLQYENSSFLFTGDAENISEEEILRNKLNISSDVLKIGHHGSNSSTTDEFLNAVTPKYAIISCGKDNDYGHPNKKTLDKLKENGIKIFRTDKNGTIIVESDGSKISFNLEK